MLLFSISLADLGGGRGAWLGAVVLEAQNRQAAEAKAVALLKEKTGFAGPVQAHTEICRPGWRPPAYALGKLFTKPEELRRAMGNVKQVRFAGR